MQRSARPNGVGGAFRKAVGWAAIAALALGAASATEAGASCPKSAARRSPQKKAQVTGFAPGRPPIPTSKATTLAIALEFSRPLVGTQDFDDLLSVTDDNGAPVKGSWVLDDKGDDEGRVLRFPYVEAAKRLHRDRSRPS